MSFTGGDVPDWQVRGGQIPLVPDDSRSAAPHAATVTLLPYLNTGTYYLFGMDLAVAVGDTSGLVEIADSTTIGWAYVAAGTSVTIPFDGHKTPGPVNVTPAGGPVRVALRFYQVF